MEARKHADGYWLNPANLRQYFDNFASKQNLDPLDEQTWYAVPAAILFKQKVRLSFRGVVLPPHLSNSISCREAPI